MKITCDNMTIWVKSSVINKVCFSHLRAVEVKQAQSEEILKSFRRGDVEGQEAAEGYKTFF